MNKIVGRVIALGLLIGLSLLAAIAVHADPEHPTEKEKAQIIEQRLAEFFIRIRDGYFDGKLPLTRIIYSKVPDGDDQALGETYCDVDGISCEIYIVPKYNNNPMTAEETLLHEMCHEATRFQEPNAHGSKWTGCMKNLANAGAFEGVW